MLCARSNARGRTSRADLRASLPASDRVPSGPSAAETRNRDRPEDVRTCRRACRAAASPRPFRSAPSGRRTRPRDQLHLRRHVVRVDDQQVADRIECVAAPVHAADVSGHHDRAAQARRREDALAPEARRIRETGRACPAASAPRRCRPSRAGSESGGSTSGIGCVGDDDLARHVALRHGALFDFKHGRARVAVQHVEEAGLVALNHDRHRTSALA